MKRLRIDKFTAFCAKMRPVLRGLRRGKRSIVLALFLVALSAASLRCSSDAAYLDPPSTSTTPPSPTQTLTSSRTPTHTPTRTPTHTPTSTPTSTSTPTDTSTITPTETYTPTPTGTPIPTLGPATAAPRAAHIPILMYHHIRTPPPGTDAVGTDLSVPPDVFDAEIKFLSDQGFHAIHITDLIDHLKNDTPLPSKPIVITFDDGYDDNYVNAFPTLKDFGFVGTFFIISDRPDAPVAGYMNWQQIEEMAANGMEIGSHSRDHRFNLGEMPPSIQWAEIKPSFDAIQTHIPNQRPVFAYPSGSYNVTTLRFLSQLGYVAAVTTMQGTIQYADAPFELRRVRIRGGWSIDDFVYWLNYWLGEL
jgi:peptidoglycan/xylan/chitin deacetylase (PgdA/CDA1 family)